MSVEHGGAGIPSGTDVIAAGPPEAELRSPYEDDAEMRAIILQFVESLGTEIPRMASSADAGDLDGLARLAHRLKGSSKVLGFETVGARFAAVEDGAKGALAGAQPAPTRTRSELGALVAACARYGAALRRRFVGDAVP